MKIFFVIFFPFEVNLCQAHFHSVMMNPFGNIGRNDQHANKEWTTQITADENHTTIIIEATKKRVKGVKIVVEKDESESKLLSCGRF